jgi:hypothetical protein
MRRLRSKGHGVDLLAHNGEHVEKKISAFFFLSRANVFKIFLQTLSQRSVRSEKNSDPSSSVERRPNTENRVSTFSFDCCCRQLTQLTS